MEKPPIIIFHRNKVFGTAKFLSVKSSKMEHNLFPSMAHLASHYKPEDIFNVNMFPQFFTIERPTAARKHLPVIFT